MNPINKGEPISAAFLNSKQNQMTVRVGPNMICRNLRDGVYLDAKAAESNMCVVKITDTQDADGNDLGGGKYFGRILTGDSTADHSSDENQPEGMDVPDDDNALCINLAEDSAGGHSVVVGSYVVGIIVGTTTDETGDTPQKTIVEFSQGTEKIVVQVTGVDGSYTGPGEYTGNIMHGSVDASAGVPYGYTQPDPTDNPEDVGVVVINVAEMYNGNNGVQAVGTSYNMTNFPYYAIGNTVGMTAEDTPRKIVEISTVSQMVEVDLSYYLTSASCNADGTGCYQGHIFGSIVTQCTIQNLAEISGDAGTHALGKPDTAINIQTIGMIVGYDTTNNQVQVDVYVLPASITVGDGTTENSPIDTINFKTDPGTSTQAPVFFKVDVDGGVHTTMDIEAVVKVDNQWITNTSDVISHIGPVTDSPTTVSTIGALSVSGGTLSLTPETIKYDAKGHVVSIEAGTPLTASVGAMTIDGVTPIDDLEKDNSGGAAAGATAAPIAFAFANVSTTQTMSATVAVDNVQIKNTSSVLTGAAAIANLTDCNAASPSDKDVLQYDASSSKWKNAQETLESLSDVNITSPGDKDVIQYNYSTSKWVNATITPTTCITGIRVSTVSGTLCLNYDSVGIYAVIDSGSFGTTNVIDVGNC